MQWLFLKKVNFFSIYVINNIYLSFVFRTNKINEIDIDEKKNKKNFFQPGIHQQQYSGDINSSTSVFNLGRFSLSQISNNYLLLNVDNEQNVTNLINWNQKHFQQHTNTNFYLKSLFNEIFRMLQGLQTKK